MGNAVRTAGFFKFVFVLCVFWSWTLASFAQLSPQQSEAHKNWLNDAQMVESVIDDPNSSISDLQEARQKIVDYRDSFSEMRDQNADRIRTLDLQINGLGPEPADGAEPEPKEITDLREKLNSELNELRLPVILSEESRNRATGLIQEIDSVLLSRERTRLARRDPSPLLWTNVRAAAQELVANINSIGASAERWRRLESRDTLRDSGPLIFAALVISIALMVRGVWLADRIERRLAEIAPKAKLLWFVVTRGLRIALPFLGLLILVWALMHAAIFGSRAEVVLEQVPKWGAAIIALGWLTFHMFTRKDGYAYFVLTRARRAEIRLLILAAGLIYVLFDLSNLVENVEGVSQATVSVVRYPLILLQALVLLRIQRIVFFAPVNQTEDQLDKTASSAAEIAPRDADPKDHIPLLRRLATMVLWFCIAAGALGYIEFAGGLVFALLATYSVVGVVLVLQRGFADLWAYLYASQDGGRDQLITALTSMFLWMATVPSFLLIWGVSPGQLLELWTQFLEGVQIGDTVISPAMFITVAFLFGIGYMLTRLVQSMLQNRLLPKTRMDAGAQSAIVSGTGYVGFFLAGLVAVTGAGLDLSSLAIVAGALSVGVGFGLQTIVSNFVSGIILLVERPVTKGDWISVGSQMGYVRDISVRSTRIETFDRTDLIVPNSDLISQTVVNYTHGNTVGRVIAPVGVAYGTDTRQVEKILLEIANAHPMVLANPAPSVVFQGFGDSSLNFEIRAILRDVNWVMTVKSDINHEIARRFSEEDIEIPFPQRDIWLRTPDSVGPAVHGPSEAAPGFSKAKVAFNEEDMGLEDDADGADSPDGGDAGQR